MNLDEAISGARMVKQNRVATQGKGTDLKPMLDLQGVAFRFIAEVHAGSRDDTLKAVPAAIAATRPSTAIFICDTYTFVGDPLTMLMMMNRYSLGDLADRFKAHDPHVKEALWVCGRNLFGETVGCTLPYEYDGRTVKWLEDQLDTTEFIGEFADAMARGFDLVAANADPGTELLRAKELGVQLRSVEEILAATPGRNEPCFCGSGRKFKLCHGRV